MAPENGMVSLDGVEPKGKPHFDYRSRSAGFQNGRRGEQTVLICPHRGSFFPEKPQCEGGGRFRHSDKRVENHYG